MAGKTYVNVATVAVKLTGELDNKYKSTLPRLMRERIEKAVNNSSKLTTKKPTDAKAEGFSLDGTLSLKRTPKGIEGEMKMALSTWPRASIFGTASSTASTDVPNPAKIDGDVQAVIDAVMNDVKAKVIREFERRAK